MKSLRLAQDLIDLRQKKGVSRKQAAIELQFSYNSLMSYELGERVPADDRKPKLARYYNTTVEELFFPERQDEWTEEPR